MYMLCGRWLRTLRIQLPPEPEYSSFKSRNEYVGIPYSHSCYPVTMIFLQLRGTVKPKRYLSHLALLIAATFPTFFLSIFLSTITPRLCFFTSGRYNHGMQKNEKTRQTGHPNIGHQVCDNLGLIQRNRTATVLSQKHRILINLKIRIR